MLTGRGARYLPPTPSVRVGATRPPPTPLPPPAASPPRARLDPCGSSGQRSATHRPLYVLRLRNQAHWSCPRSSGPARWVARRAGRMCIYRRCANTAVEQTTVLLGHTWADARSRRAEEREPRGQMLLGMFSTKGVLRREFKCAYSLGDLLTQHLDKLEQEAERKRGVLQALTDHFTKVFEAPFYGWPSLSSTLFPLRLNVLISSWIRRQSGFTVGFPSYLMADC
jgi:hypothetical protein